MRIWHVPLSELDNQRILGAHQEIHALHALVVRDGRNWGGLTRDDAAYFCWVHAQTLDEFRERGFPSGTNHQTPMMLTTLGHTVEETLLRLDQAHRWPERLLQDRTDLVERWGGSYRGRIAVPLEYAPLLHAYQAVIDEDVRRAIAPDGRSSPDVLEQVGGT